MREYFFFTSPPPPPPISFLMVRPLLLAILPIQVWAAVRVSGVSVVSARRELTVLCKQQQQQQNDIEHFPQTFFFNKAIEFIVTGISFDERQRSIYSGAALKTFFLPNAALIRGRWLIEGAGR